MPREDQGFYQEYKDGMNQRLEKFYNEPHFKKNDERWARFLSNPDNRPNQVSITGIFNSNDDVVFGVDPEVSVFEIREHVLKSEENVLENEESFYRYITLQENKWNWAGREPEEKAKEKGKSLLAQCILAVTHEFWTEIDIKSLKDTCELKEDLKDSIIFFEIHKNKEKLRIYGRLNSKQCEKISRKYALYISNQQLCIRSNDEQVSVGETPVYWTELYKRICSRESFYSGVLTNVCDINFNLENQMNSKFSNIQIEVNKTTYATVLGVGNSKLRRKNATLYEHYFLIEHPLLKKYKPFIEEYYEEEIKLQETHFGDHHLKQEEEDFKRNLKEYLKKSSFPKTVSIAGNIVTSDDYLIYVKRGSGIENEGRLACSLTGYSEVHDPRVGCYKGVLEEDKPTIRMQANEEFSFGGELAREARAELGIPMFSNDWKYSGLIVSRQSIPEKENNKFLVSPSAAAFEIIGQAKTTMNFLEVQANQKVSVEREENEEITGIKIGIYKNKKEKLEYYAKQMLTNILVNKDLIILGSLIYAFLIDGFFSKIQGFFVGVQLKTSVELLINLALITSFVVNVLDKQKKKKHKKSLSFFTNEISIKKNYWVKFNRSLRIDPHNVSYLFLIMTDIHILTLMKEKNEDC